MDRIKKIFVPTDFSPCSEEATAYAFFLAEQLDATILLTHILEPTGYPLDFALIEAPEFHKVIAGQRLDRIAEPWRRKGLKIESHLFKGDPVAEIVKKAQNLECDLIVMGTHGRSGMPRLVMGSVAEQVIRTSPLPVLTVRQQKGKETEKIPQEEKGEAQMAATGHWGYIV